MAEYYDLFISHASDDTASFVRPLAAALESRGLSVWFDEFSLHPGDSIRQSLDRGLSLSSHGVVVVSHAFIGKGWTNWELNGLVQNCIALPSRRIIPVWLDVSFQSVAAWSPSLADIKAIVTNDPNCAAADICDALRTDDVISYRALSKESDFFAHTIEATEAAIRLICPDSTDVSQALYRVDRSGDDGVKLRLVSANSNHFEMLVPLSGLGSLVSRGETFPTVTSRDDVFHFIVRTRHESGRMPGALQILWLSSPKRLYVERTIELVLVVTAPSRESFRADDLTLSNVAVLLGTAFHPHFRALER